jgi:hypothetical protein
MADAGWPLADICVQLSHEMERRFFMIVMICCDERIIYLRKSAQSAGKRITN